MNFLGDPDAIGILITVGYFLAAGLCFHRYHRQSQTANTPLPQLRFWLFVAAAYLLLGINKQADLQVHITEALRSWARQGNWYANRRLWQAAASGVIGLTAIGGITWAVWQVRHWPRAYHLAMLAMGLQTTYVLLRMVSFHHVDALLGISLGTTRLGWLIELSGIASCCIATSINLRAQRKPSNSAN
ncbi:hypothetical protein [Aureliella helgolandensis]|uniref:Uncharacterized protein n=1 Tax=Aureliella helgolandensis TaxID=2527968 RepID=A0A518GFF3_9BACT|nr:hypothetical protein [Aureliella helgolandensis]QDV27313.1 hypothetical protein Q31a_57010 [Aureliella helgolandensis]